MIKMKNFTKNPKGFTLVELVIVIAIVIILSVVSVPIYRGYVDKSKMAEGYALLGTVLSAQKTYYSEYGNFLMAKNSSAGNKYWTDNELVTGIDARGNKYFTWFKAGSNDESKSPKTWCGANVELPEELRDNGRKKWLSLWYLIDSGATFIKE